VKICHNVMLGVVTQCMAEITVLAQKAGVPRHAFLDFSQQERDGLDFTRYKAPAFVKSGLPRHVYAVPCCARTWNLGLEAGRKLEVPMPLASITRESDPVDDGFRHDRGGLLGLAPAAGEGVGDRAETGKQSGRRRDSRNNLSQRSFR